MEVDLLDTMNHPVNYTVPSEIMTPPLFHQFLKCRNFYNIKLNIFIPYLHES